MADDTNIEKMQAVPCKALPFHQDSPGGKKHSSFLTHPTFDFAPVLPYLMPTWKLVDGRM